MYPVFKPLYVKLTVWCFGMFKISFDMFFFKYINIFQTILGGMHIAGEKYDSKFFDKFRSQNIVELAVEYARVSIEKASL